MAQQAVDSNEKEIGNIQIESRSDQQSQSGEEASHESSRVDSASVEDDDKIKPSSTSANPLYNYNPGDRRFHGRKRKQYFFQFWRWKDPPPLPPISIDDAEETPIVRANYLSELTYQFITPIMILGYRRPLEATDLWKMDKTRQAETLSTQLNENFERRRKRAEERNRKIENGEINPDFLTTFKWRLESVKDRITGNKEGIKLDLKEKERLWREKRPPSNDAGFEPKNRSGQDKATVRMAMYDQFSWTLWHGVFYKIIGDSLQLTSTLVLKLIIEFGQQVQAHKDDPIGHPNSPTIGRGVGLSFALFFMVLFASIFQHRFFFLSMSVGVFSRTALISAIYSRALSLSGKARASGKLTNHISTDASRIDFAAAWFPLVLSAPIQLALCLALLIVQIGPSAIAGFAILALASPAQTYAMKIMFQVRRKSMGWTDKRSKLTQEILSGMRIVKSFSHENRFLKRLHGIRKKELNGIRTLLIIRSMNNAIAFSLPVIAAVVAFIVYKATGHDLNPARIFSALTLFQLLRLPLMFLPLAFSASTDAWNAFERLDTVFMAEQLEDTSERIDVKDAKFGLEIIDASFTWDQVERNDDVKGAGKKLTKKEKKVKDRMSLSGSTVKNDSRRNSKDLNEKNDILPLHNKDQVSQLQVERTDLQLTHNEATLTENAVGPKLDEADQDVIDPKELAQVELEEEAEVQKENQGFVDQDDGSKEKNANDLDVTNLPKDGQVSGIGAVKGFLNAGTSSQDQSLDSTLPPPFQLHNINLKVYSGELLAIVGTVGSGKSSLLNAAIGEMRKTNNGRVIWGGKKIGYSSQSSWIQNATVRDNILFGQEFDEERYWEVIKLAELEADLKMLASGDFTSIGERGVTLSGGQKQRVNIARALYYDPDIFLFDDPLSALDASVGKSLFNNAILGLRKRGKTVILVTHGLHFLPHVDRVVTMVDGEIAESGTYLDLMNANGPFCKLVEEFGGEEAEEDEEEREDEEEGIEKSGKAAQKGIKRSEMTNKGDDKGMEAEERNTGSVSPHVYWQYFRAGKGRWMLPAILLTLALMQGATILNSYWLIWWQEEYFGPGQTGLYMGVYAALGVLVALFTFLMGASTGFLSYWACKTLHYDAVQRLMTAPMSWFDVTPTGRIMNRLQKDIDVIDNQLSDSFRMLSNTFATVLGSVILITILTHYFIIAVAAIAVFYYFGAAFYRSSAREVKRLDNILRSNLYSHFGESLSGLVTIRAYSEIPRFKAENQKRMDYENMAYFVSIINQRWLGVRLDALGAIMVLVVAILATAGSNSITPGQVGIALSYVVSVAQAASWLTRQVAETENNMSASERIIHYAEALPQEAPQVREDVPLPPAWPKRGEIKIKDLVLSYRPDLPAVLKGITLNVEAGEKVAIVGRTGAGKSSLLTALLRLTELDSGSVNIDGVDVSTIGLRQLRNSIAILPQDPLLFSGTLRTNLDPFSEYDDARLWDALRRAYLVDGPFSNQKSSEEKPEVAENSNKVNSRLNLDSVIEEEGGNLSLGQRSLVSLARALVKDSRIVLLDEATASVDSETDSKIQETLRTEFADRTLLTIAHRLRSILSYNRVAVFDQGLVAEYDSPLNLFDKPDGQFRSMCDRSSISREEIVRAASTQIKLP